MLLLLAPLAFAAPARFLVCDSEELCAEDLHWLSDAGLTEDLGLIDPLEGPDGQGWGSTAPAGRVFAASLQAARDAAATGSWRAVEAECDTAIAALSEWQGTPTNDDLVALYRLLGEARFARGEDRGHESAFRQALALAWTGGAQAPEDELTRRAWLDEQRKLTVGGTGTLKLGTADVAYAINGLPSAQGTVTLYPGLHRVTAAWPGTHTLWAAEVPVLAGRESRVTAERKPEQDPEWLHAELVQAFDVLSGPRPLTGRLVELAEARYADRLELVRLEAIIEPLPDTGASVGEADPLRPEAAAGEAVDQGDGIPATYEDTLLSAWEDRVDTHPEREERRLRVVWFDPRTERFSTNETAPGPPPGIDRRFRLGASGGYTRVLASHNGAVDVAGTWKVWELGIEARLGVVRTSEPWLLYPDWEDRNLYHLFLGASWAPPWRWAPFVMGGAELYAPAAVGARLGGGLQVFAGQSWLARAEGWGAWTGPGPAAGVGVGLQRLY